jgi:hypothetical protein
MFSLELGGEVARLECDCCGKPFKSVCGFIKKDDWAYSTYFATLHTGHDEIAVGLTVSIGKWWDDSRTAVTEDARRNPLLDDFFAVSDFIIDHDPAVLSYLSGEELNITGRVCNH